MGVPHWLSAGFIGKLKIEIPLTRIQSRAWVVHIDQVYLTAGPAQLMEVRASDAQLPHHTVMVLIPTLPRFNASAIEPFLPPSFLSPPLPCSQLWVECSCEGRITLVSPLLPLFFLLLLPPPSLPSSQYNEEEEEARLQGQKQRKLAKLEEQWKVSITWRYVWTCTAALLLSMATSLPSQRQLSLPSPPLP